jgi:gliding motility-associated-like protein
MGKRKFILLTFLIFCFAASSQNLVPNPSFEDYDTSYTATIYPYFNHTFESIDIWRTEWDMFNTPDLFFEDNYMFFEDVDPDSLQMAIDLYNALDSENPSFGINYASSPANYAGFQYPRTGSNYIGLRAETSIVLNNNGSFSNNPYFEYIQVELSDSLEAGKSYEVSFFISLSENSIFQNNSLGILLSDQSEFNFGIISEEPDIVSPDSITSTEDWVEVKENYIAQGGEKFLSLGNLNLTAITDTFISQGQFNAAYYYIDDVSVFENRRIDTTLCPNDSIILTATPGSINHLWQDGSIDSVFVVTEPGTYWCRGDYDNIFHTDTFIVNYYDPLTISSITDTTICQDASIEIIATHNFDNVQYNWNTGDTTSSITVSEAGQYSISITNICQKQANVITINQTPKLEFELGNDTILCHNTSLLLTPQINDGEYNWQDGSNDLIYSINSSGQYWLSVNNECETVTDVINVTVLDSLELDLGPELEVCEFPITIDAFNDKAQYLWQDGSQNNSITIEDSSTIWVNVSNQCESISDTLKIKHFCGCNLFIPTAFTPNNDGENDFFEVVIDPQCQLKKYSISIYERWGSEIFRSSGLTNKWNGELKNKQVQNGLYTYYINYQTYGNPKEQILGKVLLIN